MGYVHNSGDTIGIQKIILNTPNDSIARYGVIKTYLDSDFTPKSGVIFKAKSKKKAINGAKSWMKKHDTC